MGPRIYPSQQDTNTTAKGSLILSLDNSIDDVNVYVNNNLVNKQYSIVNGMYNVSLNVNDVVRLERGEIIKISSTRKDYTTDDQSGNNGIINTFITGITSTDSYTFTATTSPSSYNFEYLISVSAGGARATLIYKYNPTVINNLGALFNVKSMTVYGFPTTGGTQYFTFFPSVPQFTGTTGFTFNLGEVPLPSPTSTIVGYVSAQICYITTNGNIFQGLPSSVFSVYVNGILQNTSTYFVGSPGFGYVSDCPNELTAASVDAVFTCSDGDTIEYVFDDTFTMLNFDPTPTPTITPTPTGPTPTPTPSPTPLPIITGSLFFYDPGNLNSYPGSGSVLYDLSGNGRHANINTGITWTNTGGSYFNLNGNDNNSITGTTLNLSPISWSMWMAVYRNDPQFYDGFMTEGTTDPITNGLYQQESTNRLDLRYHNGTQFIETGSGTLTTGSWNFIGGSIGTQATRHIYKSGSLSNVSQAITPATSSFNEAIFIGEDAITGQDRTINGRIGPVIMFDRELTTGELSDLDNYFKTRYGI
jgi:hypothetical protein